MGVCVNRIGVVGISSHGGPVIPPSWYILHAAPETVAGSGIEPRTDIFQTGLTLFRLLVGLGALEAKYNALGGAAYANALANGTLLVRADFPPFIPNSVSRAVLTSIDPNPNKRFQSALEMRRALEKLSFAGHWTIDANGMLIGVDARHTYRFEHVPASGSNAAVSAFKANTVSGREIRVSQFTKKNLTNVDANRLKVRFCKAVVEGKVS